MLLNPKKKKKENHTNKFNANMLQPVSKSNSNTQLQSRQQSIHTNSNMPNPPTNINQQINSRLPKQRIKM